MLLIIVVLLAVFIPAGPLTLDSHWSELMQDIQTPILKHLALVFNALGYGLRRRDLPRLRTTRPWARPLSRAPASAQALHTLYRLVERPPLTKLLMARSAWGGEWAVYFTCTSEAR